MRYSIRRCLSNFNEPVRTNWFVIFNWIDASMYRCIEYSLIMGNINRTRGYFSYRDKNRWKLFRAAWFYNFPGRRWNVRNSRRTFRPEVAGSYKLIVKYINRRITKYRRSDKALEFSPRRDVSFGKIYSPNELITSSENSVDFSVQLEFQGSSSVVRLALA